MLMSPVPGAVLAGFLTGIALTSFFGSLLPSSIVASGALAVAAAHAYRSGATNRRLLFVSLCICAGTLSLVGSSLYVHTALSGDTKERALKDERAVIIGEPERDFERSRYPVRLSDGTSVLITSDSLPRYKYGETLALTGELRNPPQFPDFDYRAFLKKEGVEAVMYYPEIDRIAESPLSFRGVLIDTKDSLRSSLDTVFPYPYNTVAAAMILGDNHRVPRDVQDVFSKTGIRHMIAISGMHITIIAGLLLALFVSFLKMGRDVGFYVISTFIVVYVIFVGAPASAVRAGVMALLFLLAYKTGRIYDAPRALALAATVMLLFNPLLLGFDVGFQLSFLAVLGILFMAPLFEKLLGRSTSFLEDVSRTPSLKEGVISLVSVSLGAHLATLPVVAATFGVVSVSAPVANMIAVPLIPVILVSSAIGSITAIVSESVGTLVALPALAALWFVSMTTHTLAEIPGSSFSVEPHWIWVPASYAILMGILLFIYTRYEQKRWVLDLLRGRASRKGSP